MRKIPVRLSVCDCPHSRPKGQDSPARCWLATWTESQLQTVSCHPPTTSVAGLVCLLAPLPACPPCLPAPPACLPASLLACAPASPPCPQVNTWRTATETCTKEKDFYYSKLRAIELLCNTPGVTGNPVRLLARLPARPHALLLWGGKGAGLLLLLLLLLLVMFAAPDWQQEVFVCGGAGEVSGYRSRTAAQACVSSVCPSWHARGNAHGMPCRRPP